MSLKLLGSLSVLLFCGVACSSAPTESSEASEQAVNNHVRACPEILIFCAEGTHAKSLPNCRQVCVPDHGWECTSDSDCSIYCITTPCPQGQCLGHQCVVKNEPAPPPGGGQTCGSATCGKGQYCCNSSCGICAPLDGYCIQLYCGGGVL
jgi:hypothetical protein